MGSGQEVAAGARSLLDLSALVFWCSKRILGRGSVLTWLGLPGTGAAGKPAVQRHREWGMCVCHVLCPCESPVGI